MSRTRNSVRNFSYAMICQCINLIVNFVSRTLFIKLLGNDYLGLNGLFSNILNVLSLAELGVGEAIIFSLYKPIADKNIRKCQMLMQLYKKIYIIIGIIIIILGTCITPFLPYIIKNMPQIPNISFIYMLFVVNTSVSYFYSYKKNFIIANQQGYIATLYRQIFNVLLNIVQIIYLIFTHNFIGYLVIKIIFTLLENIFISMKADKLYPFLNTNEKIKLDNQTRKSIINKTKAMMMHKIGSVVVFSTDNIILSAMVSLQSVGLYSNYSMILTALNTIIGQIYSSLTASVGNLCASSNKVKQYDIFKKINFLSFWIYSFSSICLVCLLNPFIKIWIGKQYIFNINIILILVTNFYISGMRKPVLTFRDAKGLFEQDRYKPIFESIINLVTSIILAKKLGILGVFLGTLISNISTCAWIEPYILFKHGFQIKLRNYFKTYFNYLILTSIVGIITSLLCSFVYINIYSDFILKVFICFFVPNTTFYLIYRNSENFQYFKDKIFNKIAKKLFNILHFNKV